MLYYYELIIISSKFHKISQSNLTFGGLNGYVSGIFISSINFPVSYGVSGGPAISPRNSVKLSSTISTFMLHLATCNQDQISTKSVSNCP